jgi:hypothetical protein
MPEDMPDRMPEDMPHRMPEDMSDIMPEELPVTKCIYVMVGITRSKVILICWCKLMFLNVLSVGVCEEASSTVVHCFRHQDEIEREARLASSVRKPTT